MLILDDELDSDNEGDFPELKPEKLALSVDNTLNIFFTIWSYILLFFTFFEKRNEKENMTFFLYILAKTCVVCVTVSDKFWLKKHHRKKNCPRKTEFY